MKIRTLIIDDELLARKLIRRLLATEEGIEIVGECADGRAAVSSIAKVLPDLIFLDVQMPEWGGFEVLERIDSAQMPVIIFVTAYDKFALKAFEANALDYLLKPLDDERFHQALNRVRTYLNGKGTEAVRERLIGLIHQLSPQSKPISRLAVKAGGRVVFLRVGEIDWIDTVGNYLGLHVGKESYLLRGRLNELEKKLSPDQFFRIHRSTIINLDRVKEFQPLFKGEGIVVLKDGTRLAASRSCAQKLQGFLEAQL
jgi:two-component system, LytTR family, response regulator